MRYFREVVLPYQSDDCLIWPYVRSGDGRAQVWLDGMMRQVSVLACEAVNGQPPSPEHEAAHSCGKAHLGCVNPHHTRWATHPENMADMVAHGTRQFGETHGHAKLTEVEVREVLAMKGKASQRELADYYGVDRSLISHIHNRRLWKHVA